MAAFPGIAPADIYLPARRVDPAKWAVVACDQFTSQPEYWRDVEAFVGDAPSTLRLIQPEIDLDKAEANIPSIRAHMQSYLADGTLEKAVSGGFVLTERITGAGARLGLVAGVDLEVYDYAPGAKPLVRATEGTILARIPPRVRIREGALLETPHAMLLIDDLQNTVIEPLYAARESLRPLYDFQLMAGGGRLRGWAVEGEGALARIANALRALEGASNGFLYAVGDGNHSLATAKACYEALKKALPAEEAQAHPARYALAEIVNLHSPALHFQPIHRALFGASMEELLEGFRACLRAKGLREAPGEDIGFYQNGRETALRIENAAGALPVSLLQPYLDDYLSAHKNARIDYIHGLADLRALCDGQNAVGIRLCAMQKTALFPGIRAGGALPRKTFSMGEAREKRYYMECRKIL